MTYETFKDALLYIYMFQQNDLAWLKGEEIPYPDIAW